MTTSTDLEPTVKNAGTQLATNTTKDSLDRFARVGTWLASAESGSKDPNAMAMSAALRMAYADSLGLPAHAASEIYIIKGTLTLSSKLCRALAHQHGLRVTKIGEAADSCTAAVVDGSGKELGRYTYTLAQAKKAGLSGTNWQNSPDRMLWARASKRVLDDFAPWVTTGVMSAEEAAEVFPEAPVPFDADEVLVGEVVQETLA